MKLKAFLLAAWLLLPPGVPQAHSEEIALEYKVKTAFIHNFIPYIQWPKDTFKNDQEPVRIGVIGKGPLASAVSTLRGKKVAGRPIAIHFLNSPSKNHGMNILVVCESEKEHYLEIMEAVEDSGVLTIGNTASFSVMGGVIGFYLHEDKVRFQINLKNARGQNLKISSKLLHLATTID